jgi:hypothetical protein
MWDRFVDLTDAVGDVAVERLEIPYEDTTLPGYFRSGAADELRRTLVSTNGSDGSSISEIVGAGVRTVLLSSALVVAMDRGCRSRCPPQRTL